MAPRRGDKAANTEIRFLVWDTPSLRRAAGNHPHRHENSGTQDKQRKRMQFRSPGQKSGRGQRQRPAQPSATADTEN